MVGRRIVRAEGERVLVHAPDEDDQGEFLDLVRRSRDLHRGWVEPAHDPAGYAAYLRRVRGARAEGYLVRRREDGALVGTVNANEIVQGSFQSAYLGFWAGTPWNGRGYMREALSLVVADAFSRLALHRLEANVQPENAPSLSLVRRLGFRREGYSPRYLHIAGRWRDHERWARLADDPAP